MFSLRCIDQVRKPLCEPNFFVCFCIGGYVGAQGMGLCGGRVGGRAIGPPAGVCCWPFWGGGPDGPDFVLVLCGSVVCTAGRFVFGLALFFVCVFLLSFLAFWSPCFGEGMGLVFALIVHLLAVRTLVCVTFSLSLNVFIRIIFTYTQLNIMIII